MSAFNALPAVLVLVAATIVFPMSALADRHCLPVLDRYYDARNAVLTQSGSCGEKLGSALESLTAAIAAARVCGCSTAETELHAFIGELKLGPQVCDQTSGKILDFDASVRELVEACH